MKENRWGAFLCNCSSSLDEDFKKIGKIAPFDELASETHMKIEEFAKKVDKKGLENIIVGCSCENSLIEDSLKNKNLHFLDLKGQCFSPHDDIEGSHSKAIKLIQAEIEVSKIKSKYPVPVNPLNVGNSVLIYTDYSEGLKLASMLEDSEKFSTAGVTICISPELENLEGDSPLFQQRSKLIGVEGRLGNFQIKLQQVSKINGEEQKDFTLKSEQIVIITKQTPTGVKKRTGIHLLSSIDKEVLEDTVNKIQGLIGNFHKPVHIKYEKTICAGGDKGIETCGRCISFCPYDAISRQKEISNRITVDHYSCEGCGACVSACPTSALEFTEPSPKEIYSRMATLLSSSNKNNEDISKPVIVFHCEEMGKSALQIAGQTPLRYSPSVLPVEVPCLRYVSESNMLAAISLGAAGVGLLGCENCPNGERELLYQKYELSQIILEKFGLGKDRIRIITTESGSEGESIRSLDEFASNMTELPLNPSWNIPRQTGNREILSEILSDFINQTGKEPGGVIIDSKHAFAFAEVNESECTLCRSCANVCPTNAFKFEEDGYTLNFKHINCVGCGLCEQVCPENVITLKDEIFLEKLALDYVTVAEDDMVACLKCNKPYINRRALEAVESKLFNIDSLKSTFSGNRKNILRMCPDCRTIDAVREVEKGWVP